MRGGRTGGSTAAPRCGGEPCGALDGALLLWVWATLCDTALVVYERVRPALSPRARARYYDEWKLVASACGVPLDACPPTWEDFESYVARTVREELRVSSAARSVAHATMA